MPKENRKPPSTYFSPKYLIPGVTVGLGVYYFLSEHYSQTNDNEIERSCNLINLGVNQVLTLANAVVVPALVESAKWLTALGIAYHVNQQQIRAAHPLAAAGFIEHLPVVSGKNFFKRLAGGVAGFFKSIWRHVQQFTISLTDDASEWNSWDDFKSKLSEIVKRNWKDWNSLSDITDQLNNAADKAIPNELKPLLHNVKIRIQTDGKTASVYAELPHGGTYTIYSTEDKSPKGVSTTRLLNFVYSPTSFFGSHDIYETVNLLSAKDPELVKSFLRTNENSGKEPFLEVYRDHNGHPTISTGINLDGVSAKGWVEAVGANFEQIKSGQQSLTHSQALQLELFAIQDCEKTLINKLGKDTYSALSENQQAALISLAASPKLIGPDLINQIKNSKWDEAENEIRHRSNLGNHDGIQNRREREADLFAKKPSFTMKIWK